MGISGVMAYAVGERTREIGVRMALGARSSAVLAMVLRRGLVVTGIGLGIGLALALALARLLRSLFYGISAVDAATIMGVLVVLAGAPLLACYLPARRASISWWRCATSSGATRAAALTWGERDCEIAGR